jgi:uncharacterized membrane protein
MFALYRIMLMIAGYVAACIAASLVLTIGTLTPDWNGLNELTTSPALQSIALWSVVAVAAIAIFAFAMLPMVLIVALTEGFALRSVVLYGVIGGLLALAIGYGLNSFGFDFAGYAGAPDADFAREREVMAAAGIAGGLVYWLFAGRNAGLWK